MPVPDSDRPAHRGAARADAGASGGDAGGTTPTLSDDGNTVSFLSASQFFGNVNGTHLYVRNLTTNQLTDATRTYQGDESFSTYSGRLSRMIFVHC